MTMMMMMMLLMTMIVQVPVLTSFSPVAGPRSGGVRLTVYGENLDIGSSRHVEAATRQCDVVR